MAELWRTTDGKVTLQSLTRAIDLWKSQKDGITTTQTSLLDEQSRMLSRGSGVFEEVSNSKNDTTAADGTADSPIISGELVMRIIHIVLLPT